MRAMHPDFDPVQSILGARTCCGTATDRGLFFAGYYGRGTADESRYENPADADARPHAVAGVERDLAGQREVQRDRQSTPSRPVP
jgi:hypothetical protein